MSSRSDFVPDNTNVSDIVKKKADELLTKMNSNGILDINNDEYKKLVKEYGHEIATAVRHLYYKKLDTIDVKAKEVAEKIYNKLGKTKTASEMIKKINKLKTEKGWSEEHQNRVIHHLKKLLSKDVNSGLSPELMPGSERSVVGRTIGYEHIKYDNGLQYPVQDGIHLSTINSLRNANASDSENDYINSMTYSDLSLITIMGVNPKYGYSSYVHPVIAMFFAIKLEIMENHVVRSDFGRIIERRQAKKEVDSRDLVLFESITFDPNDSTCDDMSVLHDIANRYKFQLEIKKNIRNLRTGNYFADGSNNIFTALKECRNNYFDSADILYESDETNFVKKLLSIFSIRSILLKTETFITDMYNVFFPAFGQLPDKRPNVSILSVPLITLTLPDVVTDYDKAKTIVNPKKIDDAIAQNIWVKEGNTYLPRVQNLITANEMILIVVKRNADSYKHSPVNPYNYFSGMYPSIITNTQVVNKFPVDYGNELIVPDDNKPYQLRSVLALKETEFKFINSKRELEIDTKKSGQVALFQVKDDPLGVSVYGTCYAYDPQSIGNIYREDNGTPNPLYYRNNAFTEIPKHYSPTDEPNSMAFQTRARFWGTVFLYAKNMFQ